jgi:hypothetical protein
MASVSLRNAEYKSVTNCGEYFFNKRVLTLPGLGSLAKTIRVRALEGAFNGISLKENKIRPSM